MNKPIDINQVRDAYSALQQTFNSLLMSTVSPDGMPEPSYAAYVKHQGNYYVYISELAAHTRNLQNNNRVSIFFIEDEDKAAHLFARQRVTYHCTAYEIGRESDGDSFNYILGLFEEKFGAFINQLKKMGDFHLYCLHPYKGSFVQGFARAFTIEGDELEHIHHVNDTGHKQNKAAAPPDVTA